MAHAWLDLAPRVRQGCGRPHRAVAPTEARSGWMQATLSSPPGVLTSPSCGRGSWGSKELGIRVPSQSGGAVMPFWVLQAPPDSGGHNKEGPCFEVGVAMPRCHRSHGRWEPGPAVSAPRGWLRPEVTVHSHGVVAGPCLPHACPLPSRMQSARLAWCSRRGRSHRALSLLCCA